MHNEEGRQNEQEVQSQLVGYRWSITKTKMPSPRKRRCRQFVPLPDCANMKDFKANAGVGNTPTTSIVGSFISTKNLAEIARSCCKGPRMPSKISGDQRLRDGYGSEH